MGAGLGLSEVARRAGYPAGHVAVARRLLPEGMALLASPSAAAAPPRRGKPKRRSLETRGTERRAVRIGIATGLVVVGDQVGEGSAQEQAVVGETPTSRHACRLLRNPGRSSSPAPPAA
jgi:hypothetical protein